MEQATSRHPVEDIERKEPLNDFPLTADGVLPELTQESAQILNAYREASVHFLFVMNRCMEWLQAPRNHSIAWWQVQFALGTAFCAGRTMSSVAKELGVRRATISKGSVEICRRCSLPPSPYMKKPEAGESYREARRKQLAA